ncbi:MAG: hypothetical protein KDB58_09565 [Solirubrobacterales bacterium]|nr:hypothetical protein [Solirubrobacterales bacterium]MCB8969192.1 hypothetical protein [Thermoleophilales bacterium]MCO5328019.1 MSCRAMM family adhesin SdrC [Solirubrobacterales bacterium]
MTKRLLPILAALVACLAIGAVTASAKGSEVGSTIKVKFKGDDEGGVFSGKVGPKECAKNRDVKVKGVGSTKTEDNGKYRLELTDPISPGKYKVVVAASKGCSKAKTVIAIRKA